MSSITYLNNYINIIKIGLQNNLMYVFVPKTKLLIKITHLLYNLGYLNGYTLTQNKLKLFFKIVNSQYALSEITLISKPSNKVYLKKKYIKKLINTNLFFICSSSMGSKIMTETELIMFNTGGKILLSVK